MKIIQALLTAIICALITVTAAADEHDHLFKRFVKMHRRSYPNSAEKQMRFAVFKKNMLEIAELNKRHNESDMFGITQFADWTAEEFKQLLAPEHDIQESSNSTIQYQADPNEPFSDKDEGIDWRKKNGVTPVKNQGKCASYWAFSTVAVIESQLKIQYKKNVDLSEQNLIDCVQGSDCRSGSTFRAMSFAMESGINSEKKYPYKAKQGQCKKYEHEYIVLSIIRITEGFKNMKSYLLKSGPFIGYIAVPNSLKHYKKGLYKPKDCGTKIGIHYWLIVGLEYNKGQPYWIIKSSWGKSWGENGYIRIAAGKDLCTTEELNLAVKV